MKSFLTLFCLFATLVAAFAHRSDYCKMNCEHWLTKKVIPHIGCKHNQKFAPQCTNSGKLVDMKEGFKQKLLDLHNTKRNLVAGGGVKNHGKACHMATMKWDEELEYLATLNVKQCNMKHDNCHNTDAFKYSGQNIYRIYSSPPANFNSSEMLNTAVENWFSEAKYSRQSNIDYYPEEERIPGFGHFTAIVADRNTHVGCAGATYDINGISYFLFVCNYATTNMITMPVYRGCGAKDPKCASKNTGRYPNLCSENEHYDVNNF